MAQSFTCCTFPQNFLLVSKNKLAGAALTKGNNTFAVLYTLNLVAIIAPMVISALFFVTQYLKDDL